MSDKTLAQWLDEMIKKLGDKLTDVPGNMTFMVLFSNMQMLVDLVTNVDLGSEDREFIRARALEFLGEIAQEIDEKHRTAFAAFRHDLAAGLNGESSNEMFRRILVDARTLVEEIEAFQGSPESLQETFRGRTIRTVQMLGVISFGREGEELADILGVADHLQAIRAVWGAHAAKT